MSLSPSSLNISLIVLVGENIDLIPDYLASLWTIQGWDELILVVNSQNETELTHPEARIISCPFSEPPIQANMGAAVAEGNTLVFLPIDTVLPKEAFLNIREALKFPSCVGGGFALDMPAPSFSEKRFLSQANNRGNRENLFLWEQVIFIRQATFSLIGGFPLREVISDFDFCRQMKNHGTLVLLHPPVHASKTALQKRSALTYLRYKMSGARSFPQHQFFSE